MPRKANTRAASGAGSIRQRPDGRWEARVTVGNDPGTGKPIRRSIYGETQAAVRKQMPDEDDLYDLAELYKVFGDSTRIKILYVLFAAELCVYDIAQLLGMTQSAVSHQLRILKNNKLVKFRREGKTVFYALDDDHVRSILKLGMEHLGD